MEHIPYNILDQALVTLYTTDSSGRLLLQNPKPLHGPKYPKPSSEPLQSMCTPDSD